MEDVSSAQIERTAGPVYFLAALFLFLPFLDFVMNVWPLNLGLVQWRYGALGLSGGFLLTPLLGFIMLMVGGVFFAHRRVLLINGILTASTGILLFLATMLFVLDSLQLRGSTPADARWVFDAGVIKSIVKLLTGAVCCCWIALVSLRRMPEAAKSRRTGGSPLVVGAAEGSGPAAR